MALRLWRQGSVPLVEYSPRPGWTLRCPSVAIDGAFRLQKEDPPQVAEFDEFLGLLRPLRDPLFFDIGCHFGLFGFAAAHFCGKGTRAIAIDPSKAACDMVRRIRDANGWGDCIEVICAAAGEREGELEMIDAGPQAAGYFVLPGSQPASDRTRVPLVTIDGLAATHGRNPDLIKIDVESYELEVLKGGERTLHDGRAILCLEMHNAMMRGRGINPGLVLDRLRQFDYHSWECAGRKISEEEIAAEEIIRIVCRKR
jgi:FkbM family methyltransferase